MFLENDISETRKAIEIAKNLLNMNIPLQQIVLATTITVTEPVNATGIDGKEYMEVIDMKHPIKYLRRDGKPLIL